jgi:hypothetical protein
MPLGLRSLLRLRKIAGTAGPGPHCAGPKQPRLWANAPSACRTDTERKGRATSSGAPFLGRLSAPFFFARRPARGQP